MRPGDAVAEDIDHVHQMWRPSRVHTSPTATSLIPYNRLVDATEALRRVLQLPAESTVSLLAGFLGPSPSKSCSGSTAAASTLRRVASEHGVALLR